MKIALIIVGSIIALGGVGALFGMIGMGDIRKMVVRNIDLSKVEDGDYSGEFHKARWNHEVTVTVKDHKLVAVKNDNELTSGDQKIVDEAIDSMIARQSVAIDVVSGASINTKAFQKAVENALEKGEQ